MSETKTFTAAEVAEFAGEMQRLSAEHPNCSDRPHFDNAAEALDAFAERLRLDEAAIGQPVTAQRVYDDIYGIVQAACLQPSGGQVAISALGTILGDLFAAAPVDQREALVGDLVDNIMRSIKASTPSDGTIQ